MKRKEMSAKQRLAYALEMKRLEIQSVKFLKKKKTSIVKTILSNQERKQQIYDANLRFFKKHIKTKKGRQILESVRIKEKGVREWKQKYRAPVALIKVVSANGKTSG